MDEAKYLHVQDVQQKHHAGQHKGYEYFRRDLITKGNSACALSQYELPPGKSSYPYHYHVKDEEAFYILSGQGIIRTPQGEQPVHAGDFLYFPPGESGAHKLTNTSVTESLIYLDFDATHDLDVCFYPDSQKYGIWGKGIDKVYKAGHEVGYYTDE